MTELALCLGLALSAAQPAAGYHVAVCRDPAVAAGQSLADFLAADLGRRGFDCRLAGPEAVADESGAGLAGANCLVLVDSPRFPVTGDKALDAFCARGGDLVFLGGRAFAHPTWRVAERWLTAEDIAALPEAERPPGFDPKAQVAFEGAFEDYDVYDLGEVVRVTSCAGQTLARRRVDIRGAFGGVSAVGFEFPDESDFVPLLAARDRHGRARGWAGGALLNYEGRWKGSAWALFGIEGEGLYRAPDFIAVLADVLAAFRDGRCLDAARAANERARARQVALTSPPRPALSIARDRQRFALPTGKPVFLMGADICGRGGFWSRWFGSSQPDVLEGDFRRMARAGLNVVRVYGQIDADDYATALREFARRHGVYLLPEIAFGKTRAECADRARKAGRRFRGEPMLLGYDLANEPYPWAMAEMTDDDGQKLYARYPFPDLGAYGEWAGLDLNTHFSTFPRLAGPLPVPADGKQKASFLNTDRVIGIALDWLAEPLRHEDPAARITVGYNTVYVAWPANGRLDFVTNHTYENLHAPMGYETIMANLTTTDRLHAIWPDKPVLVGEFAISGGNVGTDGRLLDVHSTCLAEFLHYLYAFSHGYAGVIKWMCCDWPVPILRRQATWIPRDDTAKQLLEGRLGLYWYDGTPAGRPKPLVYALRFLRDYIEAGGAPGALDIHRADNPVGVAYAFRGDRALFFGGAEGRADGLSFRSAGGRPACVMLSWRKGELAVMATADAEAVLRPSRFLPSLGASLHVVGHHGGARASAGVLRLTLLEGGTVRLR